MYAVLHMNYKPTEFVNLPQREKAFVIACITEKIEAEKRHEKEAASRAKRMKGRRR